MIKIIDGVTNNRNLVMGTEPENLGEIIDGVSKLLNRNVTYVTTHFASSGLVNISAIVTAEEYETICESNILIDILYRKETSS